MSSEAGAFMQSRREEWRWADAPWHQTVSYGHDDRILVFYTVIKIVQQLSWDVSNAATCRGRSDLPASNLPLCVTPLSNAW